ncbi:M1 family metallopeptidase [Paracrocinitomix mangrovi]|uniref:M1 family metallopeptidase n=1 Tax=Paracrocinitomix mangrovi TaxID=2862509 RepID=UPI001C8E8F1D|nr:M1 family metallopeptidase [Paracrocinitomix mangrovi]UKN00113.1 M1 family metallopeptidase [Paracrocinitomix mangrovi]
MYKWSFILIGFLMVGCSLYRPPKSPARPGSFPKFKEKDSLLGNLNEYRKNYDVTFYDLNLHINPDKKAISGSVKTYFRAVFPIRKMQIDLSDKFEIDSIKDEFGNKLKFERNHTAVLVKMKETVLISSHSMIEVFYHGKPDKARRPPWEGGLVWKKKNGKHFCGVSCEDNGSSIWWPGKDHISDKPDSIRAKYTVPKGYTCVGNGKLVEHQRTFDGFEKFTWKTSYPINHYNISFYLGMYEHFQLEYDNPSSKLDKLDFYVRSENVAKAKLHFRQAVKILKVYEEVFGPYPWWKDGYKLVESPYEGMEHQTAIAYGSKYKNEKYLNYDYIILHETAHEWWGNYVTACDMSDLWIHEGFATYAEMLYEEKTEGQKSYELSYLINRSMSLNKRPIVGPKNVFYTNYKDNDIYNKGAVVLYMLRKTIGDNDFFKIIKKFATEYYKSCVFTEDFMALVNKETGKNLDWFFEQYIYRREAPELIYAYGANADNEMEFRYKWNPANTNANFKLGVSVQIGSKKLTLFPTHEVQKVSVKTSLAAQALIDQDDYIIITNDKKL